MEAGRSFGKITIPCTIYTSLNLLELCVRINYAMTWKKYSFSLPFQKKLKHPHTVDEYSHKSNERKTLTVLRRNSIIIVNCSAEYI